MRAWHGSKVEALYSIMYHGRIFASCDPAHRFWEDAPGVYVHKDSTGHKACNYIRFVPLFGDGVFWAAKWEVCIDRADRVPKPGTDQWVQQERSVHLVALWLCGRQAQDMLNGDEFTMCWEPCWELNPETQASSLKYCGDFHAIDSL